MRKGRLFVALSLLQLYPAFFSCAKQQKDTGKPTDDSEGVPGYLTCGLSTNQGESSGSTPKIVCNFDANDAASIKDGASVSSFILKSDDGSLVRTIDQFDTGKDGSSQSNFTFAIPQDLMSTNFVVEALVSNGSQGAKLKSCPIGYVYVPGDAVFGTQGFCIMKYEAKPVLDNINSIENLVKSLSPHRDANYSMARESCQKIGKGYELISNAEWLTVATAIANLADNWSGSKVGDGFINEGNSDNDNSFLISCGLLTDPCLGTNNTFCKDKSHPEDWRQKRTHVLPGGDTIWDLAGNVQEIVMSDPVPGSDLPNYPDFDFREFNAVTLTKSFPMSLIHPTSQTHSWWNDAWDSSQGIGKIRVGSNAIEPRDRILVRGGGINFGLATGIYTVSLTDGTDSSVKRGFRCVFHP